MWLSLGYTRKLTNENFLHDLLLINEANIQLKYNIGMTMSLIYTFTKEACNSWSCNCSWESQLPHSYYFTTRILVLKFVNKGVFFEEIQDFHFPRKGGILVLTSFNLLKKELILISSVLPWKRGFILDWKVRVLSRKRGRFELKSQCFDPKRGPFSNWRTRMGTTFFREWGSQVENPIVCVAVQCIWGSSCGG